MKFAAVLLVATFSMSSFAISTEKLIEACQQVGEEKVIAQAKAFGVEVDRADIKECGVDNRPLNIFAKYVWFCATPAGDEQEVIVLTQKPLFRDCF